MNIIYLITLFRVKDKGRGMVQTIVCALLRARPCYIEQNETFSVLSLIATTLWSKNDTGTITGE